MQAALLSLTLLAGAAVALPAQAQDHAAAATTNACALVSGTVTDGTQPLAGVTVMAQDTRQLVITNSDGFFSLTLNGPAPAKLLFDAVGYEPQALTPTTCQPVRLAMSLLPGTRIRQRGRHKGFIVKAGQLPTAAN